MLLYCGSDCGTSSTSQVSRLLPVFADPYILAGFHMFCLDPPLLAIPKVDGSATTASSALTATSGLTKAKSAPERSLSSLEARDLAFRRLWFHSHPPPNSSFATYSKPSSSLSSSKISGRGRGRRWRFGGSHWLLSEGDKIQHDTLKG